MGYYDPPEDNLEAIPCNHCNSEYYKEIYIGSDGEIIGCSDCMDIDQESDKVWFYYFKDTGVKVADYDDVSVKDWEDYAVEELQRKKEAWEDLQYECYRDSLHGF